MSQIPYHGATDPNTGNAYLGYQTREQDSAMCNLRNIRVHMTIHASHPEAYTNQKCYIALVKSRVGVGSSTGIVCPKMTDIWDYTAAGAGNLLAPWELYRNSQGQGAELLDESTFKILKEWVVYLQPQRGSTSQSLRSQVNTAVPPGQDNGTLISVSDTNPPAPAPPTSVNWTYAKTRPSELLIKYTHKCMNAKLKFPNTTSEMPNNVRYFLVMVGQGSSTTKGFRVNASVKTNFIDE